MRAGSIVVAGTLISACAAFAAEPWVTHTGSEADLKALDI
jgi:hypothetical protein